MRGGRILMSLPAMWSVLLCLHLGPAEDLAVACFVRQRPFFSFFCSGGGARGACRDQVGRRGWLRSGGCRLGGVGGQIAGREYLPVRADQVKDHFLVPAAAGAGALFPRCVVLPGMLRRQCACNGGPDRF